MQSSKKNKKNNKILIKNLPVFGILSKQEDAADTAASAADDDVARWR